MKRKYLVLSLIVSISLLIIGCGNKNESSIKIIPMKIVVFQQLVIIKVRIALQRM